MCGIAGLVRANGAQLGAEGEQLLRGMLERLRHRGPDDQGVWREGAVGLGHRRLSILDLSPLGHQPMQSRSGRYVLTYNGEVYNFEEHRAWLSERGWCFRGHSDTEILLALIEEFGLELALQRCVGMFALALFDREQGCLQLARDRLGEKPLYYAWCGADLAFGSELKAVSALPGFSGSFNAQSVRAILSRGHMQADASIYQDVFQVPPGTIATWPVSTLVQGAMPEKKAYWLPTAFAVPDRVGAYAGSFNDAKSEVRFLLTRAVAQQSRADVSVGAFLSGGVDSSLVTALMSEFAPGQVRSYSIGFEQPGFNEADHARQVAKHIGTQHMEFILTEKEAAALVPNLTRYYDEPLADASQIPTIVLARMVRRDVTVALSGDGADEVFGGYSHYTRGYAKWNLPARLWRGRALAAAERVSRPISTAPRLSKLARQVPWHSLGSGAALFMAQDRSTFIRLTKDLNRAPDYYLAEELAYQPASESDLPVHLPFRRAAMLADIQSYLPGDILVKVDRATMAFSLESRAPFLDHRVVEFADGLPETFLFGPAGGKRILRELLYDLVPRQLIDRPKCGFNAPIGAWLRNGLRAWAFDSLSSRAVAPVLNRERCLALLDRHCAGPHDLSARIWPMLTIAAWAVDARK
jgi:asparagine synthase (glutamine-hydrolysing)